METLNIFCYFLKFNWTVLVQLLQHLAEELVDIYLGGNQELFEQPYRLCTLNSNCIRLAVLCSYSVAFRVSVWQLVWYTNCEFTHNEIKTAITSLIMETLSVPIIENVCFLWGISQCTVGLHVYVGMVMYVACNYVYTHTTVQSCSQKLLYMHRWLHVSVAMCVGTD